jgi:glycosyltransferase involved in cell wall biosynthesis
MSCDDQFEAPAMESSISVVVPSYNSAHYLPKAIAGIRMQAWPDLEIIIIDDGSSDDTTEILNRLRGNDLRILQQANKGPAAARNLGICAAHGTWVAFLDADDFWLPLKLKTQMEMLAKGPAAGFSYGPGIYLYSSGYERIQRPAKSGTDIFWDLLWGPQFGMSSVIVRRDCFNQVGLFDPALRMGEDWDMWLRLSARWSGAYMQDPLVVYRVTEQKAKYRSELLERCTLRVINQLFARRYAQEKMPEVEAYRSQLYAWHYSVLAKSHLRQKCFLHFMRLAVASVCTHPRGIYFLARRWSRSGDFPRFRQRAAR